jgi:hypothetical protein
LPARSLAPVDVLHPEGAHVRSVPSDTPVYGVSAPTRDAGKEVCGSRLMPCALGLRSPAENADPCAPTPRRQLGRPAWHCGQQHTGTALTGSRSLSYTCGVSSATTSLIELLHATMSSPGFAADNDGYALPSEVAHISKRPLQPVRMALLVGEQVGRFTSRPHPTKREIKAPYRPQREFKSIPPGERGHGTSGVP